MSNIPQYSDEPEGKTNQPEVKIESEPEEEGSVPTELLDLHVQLEAAGVTPDEFKEAYGAETGDEGRVGSSETETGNSEGT